MNKNRSLVETAVKSVKRALTTSPTTWYTQWKKRGARVEETRADYLDKPADYIGGELLVGGMEIMQDWEHPLMKALAVEAARSGGHVLEVGFGMGISATYLIEAGCASYTAIEPHAGVIKVFDEWAKDQPVPVRVVEGFWEDVIDDLGEFDGILFDTYPVSEEEWQEKVYVPFIPFASEHLRPGGVFTFYTGFAEALPDYQMALLNEHFSSIRTFPLTGLEPPKDCQYYSDSQMIVPVCTK